MAASTGWFHVHGYIKLVGTKRLKGPAVKQEQAIRLRKCTQCETPHLSRNSWCRGCRAKAMRAHRRRHPMTEEQRRKDRARSYANTYLRRGKLQRQPCAKCGSQESQMHHEDYSKPLEVKWLCRHCHLLGHMRADRGMAPLPDLTP